MKLLLLLYLLFLLPVVFAVDGSLYKEKTGFLYEEGNSLEVNFWRNLLLPDVSLEIFTLEEDNSSLMINVSNLGSKIGYSYVISFYYNSSILEKKVDFIPLASSLEFSVPTLENSSLIGISILPEYIYEEINFENNYIIFEDLDLISKEENPWRLESYSSEEESIIIGEPLNESLVYYWNDSKIFNFQKDFVYLDFSKKNNLFGRYKIVLKADDFADFYINDELILQTFDSQKEYSVDEIFLYGNETFFVFYGEDMGDAYINLSFYSLD